MGSFRDYFADVNIKGYAVVLLSTLVNIPVAGFMQSFGVFVKTFDKYYCPGDCLQLLGKGRRTIFDTLKLVNRNEHHPFSH
jgi:hypothetical protein